MTNTCKVSEYCDQLEWFVDIIGDVNLLDRYIIPDIHKITTDPRLALKNRPPGLHFKSGHWYAKRIGDVNCMNSYPSSQNHQEAGTANFCQTFSIMYINNLEKKYDLKSGDYDHNFKAAVKFWEDQLFEDNEEVYKYYISSRGPKEAKKLAKKATTLFRKYFMNLVNTYSWKEGDKTLIPCMIKKNLKKFNQKDLKEYLKWLKANSKWLHKCKQG